SSSKLFIPCYNERYNSQQILLTKERFISWIKSMSKWIRDLKLHIVKHGLVLDLPSSTLYGGLALHMVLAHALWKSIHIFSACRIGSFTVALSDSFSFQYS